MAVAALLIKLDSPGSIFFCQKRVGKDEKLFRVYKLRTMIRDAENKGSKITAKDDPRITRIGKILREMKIDELPQLFNVLRGEMSLVGPRPEVPEMLPYYSEKDREIFRVRPGILGVSQNFFSNESEQIQDFKNSEKFYIQHILPQKIEMDYRYAKTPGLRKDVKILFGGILQVFANSLKLRYIFESKRRFAFLVLDICLTVFALWFACLLRFEGIVPLRDYQNFLVILPLVVLVRISCFIYFGLYQTLWQYLGLQELLAIIKAVTIGTLLLPIMSFSFSLDFPPRSILFIDWILLISILGGTRILFKLTAERLKEPSREKTKKNVLIIGAGDTGELLVREFIKRRELGYWPVGFLDDDPYKSGIRIHGVKVFGRTALLEKIIAMKKADEVILAIPRTSKEKIESVMEICRRLQIPCRIVPRTSLLLPPRILPFNLRPVDISDLLGRDLVQADVVGIQNFFGAKKVLITGGGGSIGSELARVIAQNQPKEMILIDNVESNLYDIQTELQDQFPGLQVFYYLRDVKNEKEIDKIFSEHQPDILYHAAAYKHVPLLETHFKEGILNNVLGTKVIADLALKHQVEKFVLISTDKAVYPKSIMGATKRIAELYLQSLNGRATRFITVRFGNVFNSRGSVVPLFKKQLERGGPVTLTDSEVTRYFMDLSEAVFLILQASVMGQGAEIFILDMGDPVRIIDLAKGIGNLMGLSDVPIRFIGLRPGEKLEEVLVHQHEILKPTLHPKIKVQNIREKLPSNFLKGLEVLIQTAQEAASKHEIILKIKNLVPEFISEE